MSSEKRHAEQLQRAIAKIVAQRFVLGDFATDLILASLRQKLSEINNETSGSPLEGERRHATIVFSDLSGYTSMTEKMDPEEVQSVMSQIKNAAVEIVERYEGTVNQFVGDEVVALFGIPVAHENDPQRAVNASLELHAFVNQLSRKIAAETGHSLALHTGINTGLIVTRLEDERDGKYGLTGDTVNTAARIKAQADNDQIIISQSSEPFLRRSFQLTKLNPVELKGKSKAVELFLVNGSKQVEQNNFNTIIGRDQEKADFLKELHSCLENNHGKTIYIRGQAGIGKTRLLDEFQAVARQHNFVIHKGFILDFGTARRRTAIQSIICSLLGINDESDEYSIVEKLKEASEIGLLEQEELVFFYDMLDLQITEEMSDILSSISVEFRLQAQLEKLEKLLMQASQKNPLIIVIEDLHWSDKGSWHYISAIMRTVEKIPALLVMTSRPLNDPLDKIAKINSIEDFLVMELHPLDKQQAMQIARETFGLTESFAEKCVSRSEGNPLFLEQLLISAQQQGIDVIPGSIQSIVLSRLDQLSQSDKQLIQAASILGQRFSLRDVRKIADLSQSDCDQLISHHLIKTEGNEYLFQHALIQEGVYQSILKSRRKVLHVKAAEWFAESDIELSAEHFMRANDKRAAASFLKATQYHASRYNYEQALKLVEKGLSIVDDDLLHAQLLCSKGQILHESGKNEISIETYRQAGKLVKDKMLHIKTAIGMARGLSIIGKNTAALQELNVAEKLALELDAIDQLATINHLRGNIYFPLGNIEQVLKYHKLALDYAHKSASSELEANAYSGLGDAYYMRGQMRTANNYFKKCVDLAREHSFKRIEAANLSMIAWTSLFLNEYQVALDSAHEAVNLSHTIHHHRAEIVAQHIIAEVSYEQGDFTASREAYHRAYDLEKLINTRLWEAQALHRLAMMAYHEGNQSDAESLINRAETSVREYSMEFAGLSVLGGKAEISRDIEIASSTFAEGEKLAQIGSKNHAWFIFFRHVIEVSIHLKQWHQLEHFTDLLEKETLDEPLPWTDFYISMGRLLAAFYQGDRTAALQQSLNSLKGQALALNMALSGKALGSALEQFTVD